MEMFRAIRLSTGRSILRKRLRKLKRNKKFNNLHNSHKIAIAWDGSNISNFPAVSSFYHELQKENIQVDIVCFYPGKILPDEYTALRYLKCFKANDLSLTYLPQTDEIKEFINTPYEILVDINLNNHLPLQYVSVLSKAEFKVGPDKSDYKDDLDMTIKISDNDNLTYYLEQVKYYLEMINTGT